MNKRNEPVSAVIQFQDGPSVDVIMISGAAVARPYCPIVDGTRILMEDKDCGIGLAYSGSGLFPTILGAEFDTSLEGAVGLPAAIEVSIMAPGGTWHGRDVTDLVLAMDHSEILALEDGPLPPSLVDEPHVTAEIAAAVSFYFGRLPEQARSGARVSRSISSSDIEQARIVHRWRAPARELLPTFSPFG